MSDVLDFLSEDNTGDTAMDEVMAVVQHLNFARATVDRLEKELSEAQAMERKLSEEVLPTLFDNHGITNLKLANGLTVDVKEDVKATIPKDVGRRQTALSWLSQQGAGALIKDELTIDDPDQSLITELDSKGMAYTREQNVNAASLAAWFRDKFGIRKGSVCTLDIDDVSPDINVYRYRKTTIK